MTDPATQAARRAFDQTWPDQGDFEFKFDNGYAILAAKEALKPLRALHRKSPLWDLAEDCEICSSDDEAIQDQHERFESVYGDWLCAAEVVAYCCRQCSDLDFTDAEPVPWPCETAKLLYPEEEL